MLLFSFSFFAILNCHLLWITAPVGGYWSYINIFLDNIEGIYQPQNEELTCVMHVKWLYFANNADVNNDIPNIVIKL